MINMSSKITTSSFVKQNLFGYLAEASGFVSNLIFNIALPIFLGAAVFGQLSITLGFAYFLIGLVSTGFNNTMVRLVSKSYAEKKYSEMKNTVFYLFELKLLIASLFSIALFFSANWLSSAYSVPVLGIQIASFLIIFSSIFTFFVSFFTAIQKNQVSLAATFLNSFFLIILPLLFFFNGFRINGIIFSVVLAYFIAVVFISIFAFKELKKIKAKTRKEVKKPVLTNVLGFSIISLSNIFLNWGVLLVLGLFASSTEVAFFKISLSWILAVLTVVPISYGVVFSSFVNLKLTDSKKFKVYVEKVLKYGFIFIVPAVFGLFLLGGKMIKLVYGSTYTGAALPLSILSFSLIPLFANKILFSVLVSSNKLRKTTKIYSAMTITGIVLTFLLSFFFGLKGGAVSFVLINYMLMLLMFNSTKVLENLTRQLLKPAVASIIMSLFILSRVIKANSLINGLVLIASSALLYFIALFLIKGLTKEDLKLIEKLK